MGRSWDIPNMNCEPGQSKWLAKGNPEEITHKSNSNCHGGETQLLSLPESAHVSVYTYCTFFPLKKYFTCFTTFCLYGNSFLQSQRARVLVTDHWSNCGSGAFTAVTRPQPLAGNPSSASSRCRLGPPEIIQLHVRWFPGQDPRPEKV